MVAIIGVFFQGSPCGRLQGRFGGKSPTEGWRHDLVSPIGRARKRNEPQERGPPSRAESIGPYPAALPGEG
eukprot:6294112-Lingulodinium_polyedra.AAC.1